SFLNYNTRYVCPYTKVFLISTPTTISTDFRDGPSLPSTEDEEFELLVEVIVSGSCSLMLGGRNCASA
ncbi:MAG TPA: hypothetical protein VEP90_22475, partial [Methylomirabilota bacterium]|nr:hypothetical protein [Methylomirabilota bacterium]